VIEVSEVGGHEYEGEGERRIQDERGKVSEERYLEE